MYTIIINNQKLATKFNTDDIKNGLSFFTEDFDNIQVGSWRYEKGKMLLAHAHNIASREVDRTQEFIYVVTGLIKANIYDKDDKLIEEVILNPNEGLILFDGGHGYEILEEDSIVIEVKNGPYLGAEIDRRRI
jgi:hypothetical protein